MKLWHKRVGEPYSGNLRCFLGQNGHFKGFLELADFQTLFTKYDSSSVHREMSYGSECKPFGFF